MHVYAYTSTMAKHTLNLTIEDSLIEQIKIRAVKERRSVSDITEELYRKYLKESRLKKKVSTS